MSPSFASPPLPVSRGALFGFAFRLLLRWTAIASVIVLALAPRSALGYIPAQATNETSVAQQQTGHNVSDVSTLKLQWYPMGMFTEQISSRLVGADSLGSSKGALVHFSEDQLPNGTTTTPWIALVSCDANSTSVSTEDDIFTLAKDRGAVAALLYSLTSVSCSINPEYSNPANEDPVLDIFASQSLSSSKLIETQFNFTLGNSSSTYYRFNPTLLNSSFNYVETAIANGTVPSLGYIFATLTTSNATDPSSNGTRPGNTSSNGGTASGSNTNASLAMWAILIASSLMY